MLDVMEVFKVLCLGVLVGRRCYIWLVVVDVGNDVDLCLKLREAGYLVVYDAFAHLYHYESRSRGYEDSPQKQARLAREAEYMKNKWKHVMGTDPYYNRNLSLKNGYYKLP